MTKREHPLYVTWCHMRERCLREWSPDYSYYGGRGITICDSWLNDFYAFVEDMGERPEGYTLDRKDNDGNYCPDNCRWASRSTQASNKRPYTIPNRKISMPKCEGEMRNIRLNRNGTYQVRMGINGSTVHQSFDTLEKAKAFRADLEDERAMMSVLS